MRQLFGSAIGVGLLVTCMGSTAVAQSIVSGAITGTVTDSSKLAARTVDIVARNIDTKREASATTDEEGRFRIVGLPPGHYTVEVNAAGFTLLAAGSVFVEVGRATTVDIVLGSPADPGLAPTRIASVKTSGQDFSVNLAPTSFNVNVNLRVGRRFRMTSKATLEFLGEAFNLLNRTQVTELNTRMYVIGGTATASTLTFDPAFQTVSAAGDNLIRERQLQFAVRLEF